MAPMERSAEVSASLQAVREAMSSAGLDWLVLSDHTNVAWLAGGGRSYVSPAFEQGAGRVIVSTEEVILLTSNIEARRMAAEEFAGVPWRVVAHPWWEGPAGTLRHMIPAGRRAGVDVPLPWLPDAVPIGGEIARLRVHLSQAAQERARALGRVVGDAMASVAHQVQPGESEHEIAARLGGALLAQGADVPTCLVAVDERFFQWRHFLPTGQRLERYAAFSVCARRDGIILSCTRLLHFGQPPADLLRRVDAVARVDAALIAATRPGATSGELFEVARAAYATVGFPEEWRNHHQGGLGGYRGCEWLILPGGKERIEAGQLVAWNPSIPGAKSEDTFLVTPGGSEIITESEGFPYVEVHTEAGAIRRPSVLVR